MNTQKDNFFTTEIPNVSFLHLLYHIYVHSEVVYTLWILHYNVMRMFLHLNHAALLFRAHVFSLGQFPKNIYRDDYFSEIPFTV